MLAKSLPGADELLNSLPQVHANLRKRKTQHWTNEETAALLDVVNEHGNNDWMIISAKLLSLGIERNNDSCRDRYLLMRSAATPLLNTTIFSPWEQSLFVEIHKLPLKRSAPCLKNYFNSTMKQIEKYFSTAHNHHQLHNSLINRTQYTIEYFRDLCRNRQAICYNQDLCTDDECHDQTNSGQFILQSVSNAAADYYFEATTCTFFEDTQENKVNRIRFFEKYHQEDVYLVEASNLDSILFDEVDDSNDHPTMKTFDDYFNEHPSLGQ
ncbi:hypothetical protein FGO68_gene15418 [Halteria grandinella]|uniref:Myb-like domain-containing protein n=1 Tax=Halteria grandinella TaxID=5974 RepID=A0A8J8T7E6_HALGN|nr:hypothetical protein FGO68_gene15418 [Halteria grandinella]